MNPVIGEIYIEHCLPSTVLKKRKIKKKEAGNGPFFKKKVFVATINVPFEAPLIGRPSAFDLRGSEFEPSRIPMFLPW